MPYSSISDLPDTIKGSLPEAAQRQWMRVFNSVEAEGGSEQSAIRQAWGAVKQGYEKVNGEWVAKVAKAEYQGREVDLDKPFRTPDESKKFAVYVKDGDTVKIVRFGDPDMEIRRDDPEARANFRARHSCDTATDKTSARYWSCRMWSSDNVSDIAKEQNESAIDVEVAKVDDSLGLVFGWAIVSEINGEPYYDTQDHYIPSEVAMKSFAKYMQGERVAKAMHKGERIGSAVFGWPMTLDVMKAMGLQSEKTGVMIAMKPDGDEILKRYRDKSWTGFSIGGRASFE